MADNVYDTYEGLMKATHRVGLVEGCEQCRHGGHE